MKDLTLQELEERARKYAEKRAADAKRRYHLARELGFSALEAIVLQNKPDAIIKELAGQRKAGKSWEPHNYRGQPCMGCGEIITEYSQSALCRKCWHEKRAK